MITVMSLCSYLKSLVYKCRKLIFKCDQQFSIQKFSSKEFYLIRMLLQGGTMHVIISGKCSGTCMHVPEHLATTNDHDLHMQLDTN